MNSKPDGVKDYFDSVPKEWDILYSHENRLMYIFNKWLRHGLYERYRLTLENCGEISGARVLDIGCGTGRYSIEFAQRGAKRVVGIDFAPAMIAFSQQKAQEMGVADKCEFICGDFLKQTFAEPFDIIVAIGLFDYIADPGSLVNKIAALTKGRFVASYPADSLIMGKQRKIRYFLKKCPLYFYTHEKIAQLYKKANFIRYEIIPIKSINKGFLGVGVNSTT
jgi:2-polyprenyl-3-methyl-5-hydroxy-6-metoxy-1,4-benzoquinol methylase